MAEDPKALVENSYDKIAQHYLQWSKPSPARMHHLEKILSRLSPQSSILELGCGAGVPCTKVLAQRSHNVTANDISEAQITLARQHVPSPNIRFIKGDMLSLALDRDSFDAVVGFYSVLHLPREEQGVLFQRLAEWLRPGGYLCVNLGASDFAASRNEDWLGAPMFWSSFDVGANQEMVTDAGFEVESAEVWKDDEDGREVPFLWMFARKK